MNIYRNKIINKSIAGLLISFAVANSYAANDSTIVELDVTQAPYVNLLGTVLGASKYFTVDDIRPFINVRPAVLLGTLGIESNVSGNCTLIFSTQNDFKLKHIISNQLLTRYHIKYKGNKINDGDPTVIFPSCNVLTSTIKLRRRGTINANPQAGIFRDTVTITVTTQ